MLRRRASSSFAPHHRHTSPPARSGGRSTRHSPPASFRSPTSSSSFRSRFPPPVPRGIGYVRSSFRLRASPVHARGSSHYGHYFRAPVPMSPPRSSFHALDSHRRGGGRRIASRGGHAPPPRVPYHCRMDISPRRSPRRSRSRSPLVATSSHRQPRHSSASSADRRSPSRSPPPRMFERGRRCGRRPVFRGGGAVRRPPTDRSKFIGNFGRPINHPPAYEVSPDRTAPASTVVVVGAAASAAKEDANGDGAGPVTVPSVPTALVVTVEELPSNRDELYAKMMEAKKSENLDEYYRLRDALNAFDKRNPHLAYRGSGAVVVAPQSHHHQSQRRKRSRSANMRKQTDEEEEEEEDEDEDGETASAARKRKRKSSVSDREEEEGEKEAEEEEEANAEEDREEEELVFDLIENESLDHCDDEEEGQEETTMMEGEAIVEQELDKELIMVQQSSCDADDGQAGQQQTEEQKRKQQTVTQIGSTKSTTVDGVRDAATITAIDQHQRENLWASFSHLEVSEQLRLLRARIAELEQQQQHVIVT